MTVEQFILLCTAVAIDNDTMYGYRYINAIPRIYCKDGTNLSVQIHGGAHCAFEGSTFKDHGYPYPDRFGTKVLKAETDCKDLHRYGIDDIADIEDYVNKHGGIDINKTVDVFVTKIAKSDKAINQR